MMVAARFYTIVERARVIGLDGHASLRCAAECACRGDEPVLHKWSNDR